MASNELESAVAKLLESSIADVQSPKSSLVAPLSVLAADSAGDSGTAVLSGAEESVERLTRQLNDLTGVAQLQVDTTEANTSAVIENSLAQVSDGQSAVARVGKSILSFLSGGLGLVQLFGGLFGGDSDEAEATVSGYSLPSSVDIEAGLGGLVTPTVQPVTYGQDGLPRAAGGVTAAPSPTVTVQVMAMDSRSFLDHSDDIARAVKEAMLNSHSLNDVVTEL
jgi:hypothetical protein